MSDSRSERSSWRAVRLTERIAWDAALDAVPHALAHTWAYNDALQASMPHRIELFIAEAGANRYVCVIAERGAPPDLDIYTPLGFGGVIGTGDVDVFREAWAAFVRTRGYVAGYLGLHPVLAPALIAMGAEAASTNEAYVVDLVDDPGVLLKRMSESTRRHLRAWRDDDLAITTDHALLRPAFVRLFAPFMRARGAAPAYELSEEAVGRLCDAPGMSLYGIPSHDPSAVVMVGPSTEGVEYVYGVADPGARHHIRTLLWRVIRDSASNGRRWLNLGGGIVAEDSLAEFKRRLGGRPVPIVTLRQVYDMPRYERLCAANSDQPGEDYFPPYRAPRPTPVEDKR